MTKLILMSFRPEYVCNILNGEKTIEIRKKFPKDYVGWVYVYVTKGKPYLWQGVAKPMHDTNINNPFNYIWKLENKDSYMFGGFNGKVVARFWCDNVLDIKHYEGEYFVGGVTIHKASCLSLDEMNNYLKRKDGYAIHITQLEIFNKPKKLREFPYYNYQEINDGGNGEPDIYYRWVSKAPQNYCYIGDDE